MHAAHLVKFVEATLYNERMEFIKNVARDAGQLTLEGFGKCSQIPKAGKDGYDIVTEYDARTEELIRSSIASEFGEPVLGEEGGLAGDLEEAKHSLWIVDPIDGTFNFQRGLPLYGVSIAYCENGVPVCGAIHLPATDQLFSAAKGAGASLIERGSEVPIQVGAGQEYDPARLVISLAGLEMYDILASCAETGIPWRSPRLMMCAVASIAFIAAGRMDVFIDRINLWDCAAGDIILREAGGPPLSDERGVALFPEYVRRRWEGETGKFHCVAVSSQALWKSLVRGLMARAGLARMSL
jgi:myo-inositol-1(or 4)-monophosphatase